MPRGVCVHKCRPHTEETKKKISISKKGKPLSEEHRRKISECQKGKVVSEKVKKLLNHKGEYYSEDHKRKMSEAKKGNKCNWWKGGISFGDYCPKFNHRRKVAVSRFFGDHCVCCGKHVTENIARYKNGYRQMALSIHHIDHDKEQGCSGKPFNLVPLCHACHAVENHNEKEYQKYINKILEEGFKWGIWSREEYIQKVMYSEPDIPTAQTIQTNEKGILVLEGW